MAKRKTYPVDKLKEFVNFNIARTDLPDDAKIPLCLLLESVLHDTGNYKGFMYLKEGDAPWSDAPYNRRYF